jgi:hypothetical protein
MTTPHNLVIFDHAQFDRCLLDCLVVPKIKQDRYQEIKKLSGKKANQYSMYFLRYTVTNARKELWQGNLRHFGETFFCFVPPLCTKASPLPVRIDSNTHSSGITHLQAMWPAVLLCLLGDPTITAPIFIRP